MKQTIDSIYIFLLSINLSELSEQEINEVLSDSQNIPLFQNPIFILLIGAVTVFCFGVYFAFLLRSKLLSWEKSKVSPIPLGNFKTRSSWLLSFTGLTLLFTSVLQILDFSAKKSLIFSTITSFLTGFIMWKVIDNLMKQLELGKVKEIDEYF